MLPKTMRRSCSVVRAVLTGGIALSRCGATHSGRDAALVAVGFVAVRRDRQVLGDVVRSARTRPRPEADPRRRTKQTSDLTGRHDASHGARISRSPAAGEAGRTQAPRPPAPLSKSDSRPPTWTDLRNRRVSPRRSSPTKRTGLRPVGSAPACIDESYTSALNCVYLMSTQCWVPCATPPSIYEPSPSSAT